MANDVQYRSLRTSDDFIEEEDGSYLSREAGFLGFSVKWYRISTTLLYILSAMLLLASSRFPTDRQCTRKMSTWSPMIEAVEYEWKTWDTTSPSKYTGKPTIEIEMEWDYLWQYGSLGIQQSKLHLLNKSLDENWRYTPTELGGGVTAFFEAFHQVHCLNLVRQYTYRDEYDYDGLPAFDASPAKLLDHVEHCIEMLRIDLMCYSDETPYLIEIGDDGNEVVHTDSLQRCRRFEKLINWAEDRIVEPYNATLELIKHVDDHYEKNSSVPSI